MVPIIIIEVKVIVRAELVDLIARIIGTTIQKSLLVQVQQYNQEQIQSLSEEHFLVLLIVESMVVVVVVVVVAAVLQLLLLHFLTPVVVFFCVIEQSDESLDQAAPITFR
jgi:hypothetical protein